METYKSYKIKVAPVLGIGVIFSDNQIEHEIDVKNMEDCNATFTIQETTYVFLFVTVTVVKITKVNFIL